MLVASDIDKRCQVAEELVTVAYENGVNVFDTAEVYASGKYEIFSSFKLYNYIVLWQRTRAECDYTID